MEQWKGESEFSFLAIDISVDDVKNESFMSYAWLLLRTVRSIRSSDCWLTGESKTFDLIEEISS